MNRFDHEDLIGKKFGKLTVLSRGPNTRSNRLAWNVKCDCGNQKTVASSELRRGRVVSCGCYRKEARAIRTVAYRKIVPVGYSAISEIFNRYKYQAKSRHLDFTLLRNQVENLVLSNCHYCGRSPSKRLHSDSKAVYNEGLLFNGIDRKDNFKGYIADNCVPCCSICNYAKRSMSYEDFLKYLDDVASFRGYSRGA